MSYGTDFTRQRHNSGGASSDTAHSQLVCALWGLHANEFTRTVSRLIEMRMRDYLLEAHREG